LKFTPKLKVSNIRRIFEMIFIKLSILLVCFYSLGDKTVSAGLTSYDPIKSQSFLAQLIKIFSSCEPQYKLTYFNTRGQTVLI